MLVKELVLKLMSLNPEHEVVIPGIYGEAREINKARETIFVCELDRLLDRTESTFVKDIKKRKTRTAVFIS